MQLSSSRHAAAQTSKPSWELVGISTFSTLEQETLVLRLRGSVMNPQPLAHPAAAYWAETKKEKPKSAVVGVGITNKIPGGKKTTAAPKLTGVLLFVLLLKFLLLSQSAGCDNIRKLDAHTHTHTHTNAHTLFSQSSSLFISLSLSLSLFIYISIYLSIFQTYTKFPLASSAYP